MTTGDGDELFPRVALNKVVVAVPGHRAIIPLG